MQTCVSPLRLRELEGVPDDPVHALVGVDLFLDRDSSSVPALKRPPMPT